MTVVLYFPAHSSRAPSHDQHGHNVPSTSTSLPRVISLASFGSGGICGRLSDQRGEVCHDVRDGALRDPEEITNDFFDHILPLVEQRDHDRFSQREALRPSGSLIPGLRKNISDTRLKLIELLSVQPEGTMVTQRLLHW